MFQLNLSVTLDVWADEKASHRQVFIRSADSSDPMVTVDVVAAWLVLLFPVTACVNGCVASGDSLVVA
jgi:hypothetical protein